MEITFCDNCGQELSEESIFCNKCGKKIDTNSIVETKMTEEIAVTAEDSIINIKPKKTKKVLLISIAMIILMFAGGGYWYVNDLHKKEEARQEKEKQEALINTYKENLAFAVTRMMGFSILSEQVCNQYANVWSEAIKARYGIDVNGKRAYDFNEAILYQREAFEEKEILSSIKENTSKVDELMHSLNNPPAEYQNAYDKLVDLYGLYTQYADQADAPKGSLVEFNKTKNQLSSEISKLFNQIKILLPNLDEKKVADFSNSIQL